MGALPIPVVDTPCVLWTGYVNERGYGYTGDNRLAHVVAWERENGPVPAGLQVDHLCRVRSCIRVTHLEAVPQAVNLRRGCSPGMVASRAGTCTKGHDAAELSRRRSGPRAGEAVYCRACRRERRAEAKEAA